MYIEIAPDQYVLYNLVTASGELIHVGVTPFNQLTALHGVPGLPGGAIYLSILKTDMDQSKLLNAAMKMLENNPVLYDRLFKRTKSVECIETGEIWPTAAAAATAHDLTYGALLKHLAGCKSFNSVKGKTYRKIGCQ